MYFAKPTEPKQREKFAKLELFSRKVANNQITKPNIPRH